MPKRVYADERARKSIASVSLAFVSHRPPIARYAFLPLFLSLRLPRALDPRAHDHHHRGSRPRSMDDRESNARPHLALLRAPSSVPLASRASRPTALARHRSRARIFTSPRRVHDLAVQVLHQKRDVGDGRAGLHRLEERLDVFLLRTAHVVVRGFLNRHADVLRRVEREVEGSGRQQG